MGQRPVASKWRCIRPAMQELCGCTTLCYAALVYPGLFAQECGVHGSLHLAGHMLRAPHEFCSFCSGLFPQFLLQGSACGHLRSWISWIFLLLPLAVTAQVFRRRMCQGAQDVDPAEVSAKRAPMPKGGLTSSDAYAEVVRALLVSSCGDIDGL